METKGMEHPLEDIKFNNKKTYLHNVSTVLDNYGVIFNEF